MKKICVYLMVLLMSISLTACSGEAEEESAIGALDGMVEETSEAVEALEEVVETLTEEVVPVVSVGDTEPMAKGLDGLEYFTDRITAMNDYFEVITEDEEDMALLGDSMLMLMLGMKINNVSMDYVMSGGGETWELLDQEMANGRGTYDSTMTKSGDVYTYYYANKWDEGYENVTQMTYDSSERTIDHLFTSTNPNDAKTLMTQFYINQDGTLYISGSDYIANNAQDSQFVIYFDGQEMNYGIHDMGDVSEAVLAINLVETMPEGWGPLLESASFEKVFTYDDNEMTYIHP